MDYLGCFVEVQPILCGLFGLVCGRATNIVRIILVVCGSAADILKMMWMFLSAADNMALMWQFCGSAAGIMCIS